MSLIMSEVEFKVEKSFVWISGNTFLSFGRRGSMFHLDFYSVLSIMEISFFDQ